MKEREYEQSKIFYIVWSCV